MKKLVLATMLAAFAATSFAAAYACDGMKGHEKSSTNTTTSAKKTDKKADGTPKSDQTTDQKS